MASRFAAAINKEISQIIKQAVPEIYKKKMTKFGLEALIGKAFNCLFDLNLSMKRVKKVFVYKCKLTVLRNTLFT